MGQVGGNGSVIWQNQHHPKAGKFKCKNHDKLKNDELGLTDALEVWGHDEIPFGQIGTTIPEDIGETPDLKGFQIPGYFLVRLRFDRPEAAAIQEWYNVAPASVRTLVRVVPLEKSGSVIMAINVRAIARTWPVDNLGWADKPFEIRYDW